MILLEAHASSDELVSSHLTPGAPDRFRPTWSWFLTSPVGVAFFCLSGAIAATWPLAARFGRALPANLVDPLLNAAILGWNAQWLTGARRGGFWDAPIFYPYPDTLAYSEHLLGQTMFVWPIFALTGNAIATYNVAFIGSFVIAGVATYLLLESLTGRRDVALVFALAFAFSPLRTGAQVARLQMLWAGWFPLALWAIHRYAATAKPRYVLWLVGSLTLLVLSNMYMLFLAAVPVLLLMTFAVARAGENRWRIAGGFAAGVALIVLVLLPIVEPYRDLDRQMGLTHEAEHIADYSAHLTSYVSAQATTTGWLPWVAVEHTGDQALYPGMLLLLPMVAVVALPWRRRVDGHTEPVALYALMATVVACFSFGPELRAADGTALATSPYEWLRDTIPGLAAVRAPGRFGMLVGVALAVIGAIVAGRVMARLRPNARGVLIALALALVGFEALPVRLTIVPVEPHGRPVDHELYAWLARQSPSALLELPASPMIAQVENAELLYQFATLQHPHALVNGYSGFSPPLADLLETHESPFMNPARTEQGIAMLRAIHVRFVAIHVHDYTFPSVATSIANRMRRSPGVTAEQRFGDDYVFELLAP